MKVLITGITGFVGSHLAEYLLTKENMEVYGILRWRSDTGNIDHIKDKLILYDCDIRDVTSVKNVINKVKPDKIFHLAGQSYVVSSWHSPHETLSTNILGQVNIFEVVRECNINPFIQIAGSSEEYGLVSSDELPVKEDTLFRPLSPYAVSKVTQDLLGYQYYKSYGLNIIRTRAFNHTGPRQAEVFVCSDFSRQVAMIEKGRQDPWIKTGDLKAKRDFSDVRDIVRAYWQAVDKCAPGEAYNICSGRPREIGDVLNILLSLTRFKDKIKVEQTRFRPSDIPAIWGDCSKFRQLTGWKPQIPFEKTLEDMLNYWRQRISAL